VKRRICLVGAALSVVCPLTLGVGTAGAAGNTKPATKSKATHRVRCATDTSIVIPPGATIVSPPASDGREYGTASCTPKLGAGVQSDSFTVPSSGNTDAKFTWYLATGTVYGTYILVLEEGSLNFLAASWTGTIKVLGGSGTYHGVKGTGTMFCKSADELHTTCKDTVTLANLT
jgi:hypothetical protein